MNANKAFNRKVLLTFSPPSTSPNEKILPSDSNGATHPSI